jgi:hypothetical protein
MAYDVMWSIAIIIVHWLHPKKLNYSLLAAPLNPIEI